MSRWTKIFVVAFAATMLGLAARVEAASWYGAVDGIGCTWARVRIDNLSANSTTWTISNCRTAVASTDQAAETDAAADWDGVAAAGATTYVWVYGLLAGDVNISTSGGTVSGFNGSSTPDAAGDGEWVIEVAADGSVTAWVETASYSVPSLSGTLPNFTE